MSKTVWINYKATINGLKGRLSGKVPVSDNATIDSITRAVKIDIISKATIEWVYEEIAEIPSTDCQLKLRNEVKDV